MVEGECWYAIIVMYDVSLLYHVFQPTVETVDREEHQHMVYIIDHVLPLFNRRL